MVSGELVQLAECQPCPGQHLLSLAQSDEATQSEGEDHRGQGNVGQRECDQINVTQHTADQSKEQT